MSSNVAIIGDSLGAIVLYRELREKFFAKYTITIDNKNYPYSLRKKEISKKTLILQDYAQGGVDILIVSNPAMALNIGQDRNYLIVDGLKNFYTKFEEGDDNLVLTNKYYKDFLKNKYPNSKIKDIQILLNSLADFDFNLPIIKSLLKEYIGREKNIFILDTSLSLIKDTLKTIYPDKNFYFLNDFIREDMEKIITSRENKKIYKPKYRVTAYRRGFYLSCEEVFKENYISTKRVVLDKEVDNVR